ncbi:MAG: hypothetical protein HC844_02530 [Tabrizicola sp.]|nr:hypothetical protein [Tabrizicola sp.]
MSGFWLGCDPFHRETSAVDLRCYDGSEDVDGQFGLSLTCDATLSGD